MTKAERTFPPRNRADLPIPGGAVEIEHAGGVLRMDRNGQVEMVLMHPASLLDLETVPGQVSVISGKPAIVYRAGDLAVALTVSEYVALVGFDLEPAEFFTLREAYGDAFDWHDDFYDPVSGEAFDAQGAREAFRLARELATRGAARPAR